LASEAQRAAVLVDAAQAHLGETVDPALDLALVASARTLAGEAAMVAGRTAHQVHGAIGVTMELPLQRYTRRLWEWAVADGGSARWARALGERAVAEPLGAWQLITGVSASLPPVAFSNNDSNNKE
jgi:acyl-CoA dehydrogenase